MKKLLTAAFAALNIFSGVILAQNNSNANNGQGTTQWKTNGNIADSNHFIGTKNEFPVKFRSYNVERLRITPEGNIGIGTSDPQEKLDVFGNVIFRNELILPGISLTNSLTPSFLFLDENGAVKKGDSDKAIEFIYQPKLCAEGPIVNPAWQNGLNKIFVYCPQINVGIGTNTPRVKLDVQGVTYTSRLAIGATDPLNMTGRFHLKVSGVSETNTSTLFLIENEERRLFQINNDGIVRTREVFVNLLNWADYVFYDDYELKPLNEVNDFITKNGHLPNVPSANEVEENGIALGEMNKILLEKIEELTLYLIEQEQRLIEQELRIDVLESQSTNNTIGNEK